MKKFFALFQIALLLIPSEGAPPEGKSETEGASEATVRIAVMDDQNVPIARVPLQVDTSIVRQLVMTADDGLIDVACRLANVDRSIRIRLANTAPKGSTAQESQAAMQRYAELKRQYAFDRVYRIPVVDGQKAYTIKITAWPAIVISGTLIRPNGHPLLRSSGGLVIASDGTSMATTDANAHFQLGGIRRGIETELFIGASTGATMFSGLTLTKKQTRENLNLGGIEVPERECSVPLFVTLSNGSSRFWDEFDSNSSGLTLISEDRDWFIISLMAGENGLVESPANPVAPQVPPGRYRVAPGVFVASPAQIGLREALRRGIDLTGAGIPQILAVEHQRVEQNIDLLDTELAIRKLMRANDIGNGIADRP